MTQANLATSRQPNLHSLLAKLGLVPANVSQVHLIESKHGHRIYRLQYGCKSLVLKWTAHPTEDIELRSYALLQSYDVPTLHIHACTEDAFLVEDLESSKSWRLATEDDTHRADVGRAVALWYQRLHAAGERILSSRTAAPVFLKREMDALTPQGILHIGETLGLAANSIWRIAAEHLPALQVAIRAERETVTYNDFYWSNLALSRSHTSPAAIIFDYHLLGIGLRYSDCRNVTGSLREPAKSAFGEAYGPINEGERILDAPISVLYSLWVAIQRPTLPRWARPLLDQITSGATERDLHIAIELVSAQATPGSQ